MHTSSDECHSSLCPLQSSNNSTDCFLVCPLAQDVVQCLVGSGKVRESFWVLGASGSLESKDSSGLAWPCQF